eukprot:scaffold247996_cov30-Tisochrysis_lutea.AAC.1
MRYKPVQLHVLGKTPSRASTDAANDRVSHEAFFPPPLHPAIAAARTPRPPTRGGTIPNGCGRQSTAKRNSRLQGLWWERLAIDLHTPGARRKLAEQQLGEGCLAALVASEHAKCTTLMHHERDTAYRLRCLALVREVQLAHAKHPTTTARGPTAPPSLDT